MVVACPVLARVSPPSSASNSAHQKPDRICLQPEGGGREVAILRRNPRRGCWEVAVTRAARGKQAPGISEFLRVARGKRAPGGISNFSRAARRKRAPEGIRKFSRAARGERAPGISKNFSQQPPEESGLREIANFCAARGKRSPGISKFSRVARGKQSPWAVSAIFARGKSQWWF